ncbi:MAG: DUF6572 domain-containing protein [Acidiferrobacteraceae bacterium]
MSIDQTDTIDFVTIENGSGDVLLTISDHLDWDQAEGTHLVLLQSKLNAYLRFIESGELQKKFPESIGRDVVINLVSKFPLSEKAAIFLKRAEGAISNAGFRLQSKLQSPN